MMKYVHFHRENMPAFDRVTSRFQAQEHSWSCFIGYAGNECVVDMGGEPSS